jgi:hypothetical protein
MCVLIFCTDVVWNISHSKNNSAGYDHECELVFKENIHFSCHRLIFIRDAYCIGGGGGGEGAFLV